MTKEIELQKIRHQVEYDELKTRQSQTVIDQAKQSEEIEAIEDEEIRQEVQEKIAKTEEPQNSDNEMSMKPADVNRLINSSLRAKAAWDRLVR